MAVLDCQHEEQGEPRRACPHLLENREDDHIRQFTGRGLTFELLCTACSQRPLEERDLRTVCQACFEEMEQEGCCDGSLGMPEVIERASALFFSHETVSLAKPLAGEILDIQPVASVDQQLWIAVTRDGQVLRLDLDRGVSTVVCTLSQETPNLAERVCLHLSPDGTMAAVVNAFGRYGVVIDLEAGLRTMTLERSEYHLQHCRFPVAFFQLDGRLLLVHSVAWNQLHISDPRTGERLTERTFAPYVQGGPRPEHYLNYFHCDLTVSPDQAHVVDNGWVWHPAGIPVVWSLRRWLENVWESEDGPSRKALCQRTYYWSGPLCWIDDRRLALWGQGEDEQWLIPAVLIFDVVSGKELRWFVGPKGRLVFDGLLFSFDSGEGMTVWDVNSGERLFRDSAFCPMHYHRGAKTFLTLEEGGGFRISRLGGQPVSAEWLTANDGTVARLARGIQADRTFDGLPALADALEEAGCEDAELLEHCRHPGPHTAACWVIEYLLTGARTE